jgi:hypothetical protein
MAVQLSAVSGTLLPPTITGPIFKKASETSAVMSLARKVPLAVNAQTAIPVPMDIPTAGWVSEGGSKPVATGGIGVKIMTGKKVALLVPLSQEVMMTNSAGLYDQLQQDLPTAISRAFDYAAIHGTDLRTGGAGPFSDYLASTPNSQVIGSSSAATGGVYADLVKGVQQVVNGPTAGYNFSGFACDPRLKPELMLSTDVNGRPLMVDSFGGNANVGEGAINSSLIGYQASYNTGVSGRYYRSGNAVQVVTVTGTPTGGTFTLTVEGNTTAPIAYNASAATIQTALQALGTGYAFGSNGAASGATVTGAGPYTITLSGAPGPISANGKALTGGTNAGVTVADSPNQDTGLRAIGGDFSQCAYGQGMDITMKVSSEANYFDGTNWHSAFQENLVLLLVEAYFGFVVNDPTAFVAYTHAAGS